MNVGAIATEPLVTCNQNLAIADVACEMRDHEAITVVVVDGRNRVVGIVTDRDLAVRAVACRLPSSTPVAEVMTREVIKVSSKADLGSAFNAMTAWGVRRVVLTDVDQQPLSMVSDTDMRRALSDAVTKRAVASGAPVAWSSIAPCAAG